MTRLVIGATVALVGVATVTSTAQGNFGVRVFAREAENTPSGIVYEYEIRNNGPRPIAGVYVGWRFGTDNFELLQPPLGWTLDDGIPAGSATSPPGWKVEAIQLEHSRRWTIEWSADSAGAALQPGQTLGGFSVRTASTNSAYRLGRWSVIFTNGAEAAWWLEPFEDPTVPPDTVPPAVAIIDPAANSLVANTIPITVHADDDTHVDVVQFLIDGKNVQVQQFGDPVGPGSTREYTVLWDTLAFADGSHELGARAFDDAGNETWATPDTVTVNNAGGPPPPGDTEAPVIDVVTPIATQEGARVVRAEGSGTPIRELIAHQEARLTLEYAGPPGLWEGPPRGADYLEWRVGRADLILLVDVVAGSPRLTERADFIVTDWRARVERVFKRPDDSWTAGRDVTFTTSGGTMKVEGTVVDAVVPWARPVRVGARYLIFSETAEEFGDESIGVAAPTMYEFAGLNTVRRLLVPGERDALEASFQAEVVTRLEELTGAR